MQWTCAAVRRQFIEFFQSKPSSRDGHTFVPSSPVVPHDDPTLLFTNAGMNQFKPIFLGQADPRSELAKLKRAANSQKCIRAGGKHNDLDDVGKDTYHHTFFEMLGNWSFGDYFKAESIAWGWELLTSVYGMDPSRLYATYFGGNEQAGLKPDEEARDIWLSFLPPSHVIPGNMKDNFWEMGDTGPCGPCSEIHFDRIGGRSVPERVNTGDPNVLEIWNHVFIQFNREADGSLRPLPAKHVDTGMGLERLVSCLQGKSSNYDTDVFAPIFAEIERLTGARPYSGKLGAADKDNVDTAYRVIADHIRTLTFAITDGALPSNLGRGYVLRRILRRAVRYGRQMLNAKSGFFATLVPVLSEHMGEAFPELRANPARVADIIREEEESFGRTLDRGIRFHTAYCAAALRTQFWKEQESRPLLEQSGLFVGASTGTEASSSRIAQEIEEANKAGFSFGTLPPTTTLRYYKSAKNGIDGLTPDREFAFDQITPAIVRELTQAQPSLSGEIAFRLHDTYGFPIDLTVLMAEERGLAVDMPGYDAERKKAEDTSRAGGKQDSGEVKIELDTDAVATLHKQSLPPTEDYYKFEHKNIAAKIVAIWDGDSFVQSIKAQNRGTKPLGVVLNKTNFYAEMGGQEADHGRLTVTADSLTNPDHQGGELKVESVRTFGGYVLHIGHLTRGHLAVGEKVMSHVEMSRRGPIESNHTATHLVNFALRKVLGDHVDQKGSAVAPDRMRFDFTNSGPVAPNQLAQAEDIVRRQIAADLTVFAQLSDLKDAKKINGLRAVFGEAYPDPVRVIAIGEPVAELLASPESAAWRELSVEFCGGTHVASTGKIGAFALIGEEAVAKGVRRVVALSGVPAEAAIRAGDELAHRVQVASLLPDEKLAEELNAIATETDKLTLPAARKAQVRDAVAQLQERVKSLMKKAADARAGQAVALARQLADSASLSMDHVIIGSIEVPDDRAALLAALKVIRDKNPKSAAMLLGVDKDADKIAIVAAVPEAMVARGLKAGDWVREAAAACGGKGGGKPDNAQGGGSGVGNVKEVVAAARTYAHKIMK
jgi:alanyl-tRNA synthetase